MVRVRPARSTILIAFALLASACSKPVASAARPAEEIRGADLFISCAEIFKPGKNIDAKKAATACHDIDGKALTPQYMRCVDGRNLYRIDATMSETPGWGFTNGTFTSSDDLENDPAVTAAVSDCRH
jgi:hypothetical protein